MKLIYEASPNGTTKNDVEMTGVGRFCITGPGATFGYHSWYLFPNAQFQDMETAEHVAHMCNEAYKQGYAACGKDIKKVLGGL